MKRLMECKFVVYYNKAHKHVTIHKIFCKHLGKNGWEHQMEQGGYGFFVKKFEAKICANALGKLIGVTSFSCTDCIGYGSHTN